ncbi:hypothetical protein BC938DRAFT_477527 [Jimgerdemannia flammicorona]|uniref:Uncharacterized protein n=1 Tax=Jimgerdemannia flammicorona TaxID=994334 RepID=A0A433QP93_9FUNG|nr:hypothetical protein BC938DRAFT_477527 [Jimgerdemannia flammicorona]
MCLLPQPRAVNELEEHDSERTHVSCKQSPVEDLRAPVGLTADVDNFFFRLLLWRASNPEISEASRYPTKRGNSHL